MMPYGCMHQILKAIEWLRELLNQLCWLVKIYLLDFHEKNQCKDKWCKREFITMLPIGSVALNFNIVIPEICKSGCAQLLNDGIFGFYSYAPILFSKFLMVRIRLVL